MRTCKLPSLILVPLQDGVKLEGLEAMDRLCFWGEDRLRYCSMYLSPMGWSWDISWDILISTNKVWPWVVHPNLSWNMLAHVFLFPIFRWVLVAPPPGQIVLPSCWLVNPSVIPVPGTGQPPRYVEKHRKKECKLSQAQCGQISRFETWVQCCLTPPSPVFTLCNILDFDDLGFVWVWDYFTFLLL